MRRGISNGVIRIVGEGDQNPGNSFLLCQPQGIPMEGDSRLAVLVFQDLDLIETDVIPMEVQGFKDRFLTGKSGGKAVEGDRTRGDQRNLVGSIGFPNKGIV